MILVDTSIWVDHLRAGDAALADLLNAGQVLVHPFVIGELALGDLRQRQSDHHVFARFAHGGCGSRTERARFHRTGGSGIGYIDDHLLTATQLTPETSLWTRDRRLSSAAQRLGLAAASTNAPDSP